MAQKFRLKNAEEVRRTTTMIQQKKIKKMYEQLYKDINKEVNKQGERMRDSYLKEFVEDIQERIDDLDKVISDGIIEDMRINCETVVGGKRDIMRKMGFGAEMVSKSFLHVPGMVVRNIANGNVYQNGWSLSKAIWGHNKQIHYKINRILAMDAAQGKSAYDTAKDIEKFVNPSARKRSRVITWVDENGKTQRFYFGNVDYNAQRLARTMIGHAYQQSFEEVNRYDPFVTGYIWLASGLHGRMCKVCEDRDGQFFKKNELPLDHPNGMCTFEAYMSDDLDTISKKIDEWYKAPSGTYPDIDRYAMTFLRG